ncbi:MAG TPA: pilus assembly protein N-terminal domain-containing protein, partial [Gemmataceae bacterium]|nr:pilus assembly protein N-terminal domain-containing protein [Gemmataceae bacterium]
MHRTRVLYRSFWGVLLALLLGAVCAAGEIAVGQPAPVEVSRKEILIPVNGTYELGAPSKKKLKKAFNVKDSIARVQPKDGDPYHVLVTGMEPGITHVTLTDEDDKVTEIDVVVQFDVEYLKSVLTRAVPTANVVPVPAANNTVILTGTVARAEDIEVVMRTAQSVVLGPERVVNALRVPGVMQVQLCCVVARVAREDFRRMAFDFLLSDHKFFLGSTVGQAVSTNGLAIPSEFLGPFAAVHGPIGTPNGAPTNILTGVISKNFAFVAFLQALRDENLVKLLAEPRLVTLSGRQASFLDGGEQAIPVPAGLGQVGVQFEEFGTRLSFVPIVLGDGRIRLEVEPEVSNLDPAAGTSINGTVVPGRTTQRVHTTVELEDGQTFVIGGLIQNVVRGSTQKVPVLGDLPFLGVAFSSKAYEQAETELVVMVTPHLVDPMDCSQAPKVLPGMETRRPDDFELFLEGILEAPRGQREVCPDGTYRAAWKNDRSASVFPCGTNNGCGKSSC